MGAIQLKTPEQIELLRAAATLVGHTLGAVGEHIRPGVTTAELDTVAEAYIRDHGGTPAFKGYKPSFSRTAFPATLCTSVNAQVVHGMPSKDVILRDGDIVSVDCGVLLDGYYGDSAFTFPVGEVRPEVLHLLRTTLESLELGLAQCAPGKRLGDLGHAVQTHVEAQGFGVVREMVGHGIGQSIHEGPEVANYGAPGSGQKMKVGMTLCVEPMINLGTGEVYTAEDKWAIVTQDGQPSAHYERTVAITAAGPDVLTPYDTIRAPGLLPVVV